MTTYESFVSDKLARTPATGLSRVPPLHASLIRGPAVRPHRFRHDEDEGGMIMGEAKRRQAAIAKGTPDWGLTGYSKRNRRMTWRDSKLARLIPQYEYQLAAPHVFQGKP